MNDISLLIRYDANKKTDLIAFFYWMFFGLASSHRFYLDRRWAGAQLGLGIIGILFLFAGIPFIIAGWLIWWVIDAFYIPGWIRDSNLSVLTDLEVQSAPTIEAIGESENKIQRPKPQFDKYDGDPRFR